MRCASQRVPCARAPRACSDTPSSQQLYHLTSQLLQSGSKFGSRLQLGAIETLDLEGMSPPSAEDGRRFGGALNLCSNLKTLLMQKVELRDETMQARHAPFHLQSSHVRRV